MITEYLQEFSHLLCLVSAVWKKCILHHLQAERPIATVSAILVVKEDEGERNEGDDQGREGKEDKVRESGRKQDHGP